MMKKTNLLMGFTLIELLVVIAIIGILAAIILVSFPSANNKAKDSRVLAAINQLSKKAAVYWTENNNYTAFDCALADIKPLCDDIKIKAKSYPITPDIIRKGAGAANICGYAESNTTPGIYFCFDGTGLIGKTPAGAPPTATCTAALFTCPIGTIGM